MPKSERYTLYLASLLRGVGELSHMNSSGSEGNDFLFAYKFAGDNLDIWEALGINVSSLLTMIREDPILDEASRLAIGGEEAERGREKRLVPVLAKLGQDGHDALPLFPSSSLRPDHFPVTGDENTWKSPWEDFLAEFKRLPTASPKVFCESLLYLLEKHADRCRGPQEDISIYANTRARTAIALSLQQSERLLLVSGDVSGIQSFLYDLVSKSAAKLLKGRSFYLQLLVDSILFKLEEKLGLELPQVIYASGGGFLVLTSDTAELRANLEELRTEFERKLYKAHRMQIGIAMDWIGLEGADLGGAAFKAVREDLNEKLNIQKKRRGGTLLGASYQRFFQAVEKGGTRERDAITDEEFSDWELADPTQRLHTLGDIGQVKKGTWNQIRLGAALRSGKFRVLSNQKLPHASKDFYINPAGLGVWHYFRKDLGPMQASQSGAHHIRHLQINHSREGDLDFLPEIGEGGRVAYGFVWYGGNVFPVDEEGNPGMLEDLVGVDEEGGFHRLGVLRMDVDNLGMNFNFGLPKEELHLARLGTLSRALDCFFMAFLNHRISHNPPNPEWSRRAYIVYAGGDDLFLLGRWDIVMEIAVEIRHQFFNWTGKNPKLTLSAGIATVTPKFPVIRAAESAGEAEDLAKEYQSEGKQKDALTLFGIPLRWDSEFKRVIEIKDQLEVLLDRGIPPGFLQKVMQHARLRREQLENQLPERWRWTLAWNLKRLQERVKDKTTVSLISDLMRDCATNSWDGGTPRGNYHSLELTSIAARILELQRRTETYKRKIGLCCCSWCKTSNRCLRYSWRRTSKGCLCCSWCRTSKRCLIL